MCFSSTENHLSGCGVGSDHDAGTYVPCSDRVNPHFSQESKRRPVTHCQAVKKIAGSDVSCIQRDTFWPAVCETPTVVAQDHGVYTHFAKYGVPRPFWYCNAAGWSTLLTFIRFLTKICEPLLALLFSCHRCALPHKAVICKSGGIDISPSVF